MNNLFILGRTFVLLFPVSRLLSPARKDVQWRWWKPGYCGERYACLLFLLLFYIYIFKTLTYTGQETGGRERQQTDSICGPCRDLWPGAAGKREEGV